MSRRVWFAALFVVSLIVMRPAVLPDVGLDWPTTRNVEAAAPSGATSPAPLNSSFDAPVDAAVLNSVAGRSGIVEPPGWKLASGGAHPEKTGGPDGRSFALLNQGEATLVSSAFTLSPTTTKFSFTYRFRDSGKDPSVLQAFILSGPDLTTETKVFDHTCACSGDWTKFFLDASPWAGQTIKIKFVRPDANGGTIGIADVASDLLQAKIGRDHTSAFAGDPVDTSNGNFKETVVDVPVIAGKGVPIQFSRYYNANSTYSGNLGANWTHTYSINVKAEQDGSKTVRYADGHTANFAAPAQAPNPSFEAASSYEASPFQVSQISWSHTVGSNSNRLLLVEVTEDSSTGCGAPTSSVTYSGQSLTRIASRFPPSSTHPYTSDFWYLINPPTGPSSVVATFACADSFPKAGMAMSFYNVAQNAAPTQANSGGAQADPIQTSISSTTSDLIADFVVSGTTPSTNTAGSGQSSRISAGSPDALNASTKVGASSSTTMSWTSSIGYNYWDQFVARIAVSTPTTGDVTYSSPAANFDKLTGHLDGTYTLTTTSQIRYNFDSSGKLTSIQDRNNNTTTVAYNGSGYLASVTDPGGRSLTFATNGTTGKITSVTDPLGRVASFNTSGTNLDDYTDVLGGHVYYTYNSGGSLLLTKQNALTNQEFSNTYDSANRVVKQMRISNGSNTYMCFYYGTSPSYTDSNCPGVTPAAQSGETIVVDARGNKTKYAFDTTFRTYSITDALSGVFTRVFDTNNNVTCATDQLGNKTALTYDATGNVTHIIDPLNTNSSCQLKSGGIQASITYSSTNDPLLATDGLGRQTAYTYNAAGNLTQVDSKDASSVVKLRSCFTVNGAGLVTAATQSTTLTNCTGNTAGYSYDAYGDVTAVTNARFYGQPTPPQTTLTYDLGGRKLTVTNEIGHANTYTYNNFNEVLTAKDNLNDTLTYTYDAGGSKKTAKDALNNTTTYNYDNLNRLTSIVDALSDTTTYAYDANDNRTSVTNARGKVSNSVYDVLNRPTSVTDPDNRTASIQYDLASRATQRTDGRGLVTKYFYDAASRSTSLEHWNGASLVDSYTYQYDAVSNRTQMIDPTGTTNYVYDALNRLSSATFPGSRTVSYLYDNVGNRSRLTYPDSKQVNYTYDAASNLSTVSDWNSNTTTYAYNNAGSLTTTSLPAATGVSTTYAYDAADRLTQVGNARLQNMIVASFDYASSGSWTPPPGMTEDADKNSKGFSNSSGVSIEMAHAVVASGATGTKTASASANADVGNAEILALNPAAGSTVVFASSSSPVGANSGNLTINKPSGTVQNDVLIASISVTPSSATITPPSGWTLVSRSNNSSTTSNSLAVYSKVATSSEGASYTWTISTNSGSAGGISRFTGVDTTTPIGPEATHTTSSSLSHATLSISPTVANADLGTFAYTLNADGNRTQVVDGTGTTTYGYDALQRLTSVTYPGPSTDSYTYDAVSNRATKNSTTYTYDDADQLTAVGSTSYGYDSNGNQTSSGSDAFSWDHENRLTSATVSGTQTTYTYNADGLRQTRASGGTTTSYIWDVTTGATLQDGTYTYVYGLGLISTTDGSANQTYYLKDGLGNTVALCNGSGTVTATYTYDVFGAVKTHTGASTEYNFTGEDNDPNGLEYLRARYYDNATGRFMSGDPTGSGYGYAGGNPVNKLDPTGLFTQCGISDNPDWLGAYMCIDSTALGNPACDPAVAGDSGCYIHAKDGDVPLSAQFGDVCVFDNAATANCHGGQFDVRNPADNASAIIYAAGVQQVNAFIGLGVSADQAQDAASTLRGLHECLAFASCSVTTFQELAVMASYTHIDPYCGVGILGALVVIGTTATTRNPAAIAVAVAFGLYFVYEGCAGLN